jgi:hypothetical protein
MDTPFTNNDLSWFGLICLIDKRAIPIKVGIDESGWNAYTRIIIFREWDEVKKLLPNILE